MSNNAALRGKQRTKEIQEEMRGMAFDGDPDQSIRRRRHHHLPSNFITDLDNNHDTNNTNVKNYHGSSPRRSKVGVNASMTSIASIAAASITPIPSQRPTFIEASKGGFLWEIIVDTPPGHGERTEIVVGRSAKENRGEPRAQILNNEAKINTNIHNDDDDDGASSSVSSEEIGMSQIDRLQGGEAEEDGAYGETARVATTVTATSITRQRIIEEREIQSSPDADDGNDYMKGISLSDVETEEEELIRAQIQNDNISLTIDENQEVKNHNINANERNIQITMKETNKTVSTREQEKQQKHQEKERTTHLAASAVDASTLASGVNQSPSSMGKINLDEKPCTKETKEKKILSHNSASEVSRGIELLTTKAISTTKQPQEIDPTIVNDLKSNNAAHVAKKKKKNKQNGQQKAPSPEGANPSEEKKMTHIVSEKKKKKKKKTKASVKATSAAVVTGHENTAQESNSLRIKQGDNTTTAPKKNHVSEERVFTEGGVVSSSIDQQTSMNYKAAEERHQSQLSGRKEPVDAMASNGMKKAGPSSSSLAIKPSNLSREYDSRQLKKGSQLKNSNRVIATEDKDDNLKSKQQEQDNPDIDSEDNRRQLVVGERPSSIKFSPDVSFKQKMTKKGMSRKGGISPAHVQEVAFEHPMMKFDRELDEIVNAKSNSKSDSSSRRQLTKAISIRGAQKPSREALSGEKHNGQTMKREPSLLKGLFTRQKSNKKV